MSNESFLTARIGKMNSVEICSLIIRLEFDLAMQSNDLKRALECLLTMSNSREIGQERVGPADVTEILNLTVAPPTVAKQENLADAVQGIVKFVKEFFDLIDAADATGQSNIAREVLKRLAAAASVKGALRGQMLRGLALRLANHGELTRLSVCYFAHSNMLLKADTNYQAVLK